jgi:hypothetical protein
MMRDELVMKPPGARVQQQSSELLSSTFNRANDPKPRQKGSDSAQDCGVNAHVLAPSMHGHLNHVTNPTNHHCMPSQQSTTLIACELYIISNQINIDLLSTTCNLEINHIMNHIPHVIILTQDNTISYVNLLLNSNNKPCILNTLI